MPKQLNRIQRRRCWLWLGILLGLSGCATYDDRVAPVPLPTAFSQHVNVAGALIAATPYVDADKAEAVFGFDIRSAGLLPVRLVIDNQSDTAVVIQAQQTFLIDKQEQAWPLLTQRRAYRRVEEKVEIGETLLGAAKPSLMLGAAGAVAGFAIGVLTGENLGETIAKGAAVGAGAGALYGGAARHQEYDDEIRQDLLHNSLRNERIKPGELAYGYLFFPGKDEAESATALRLGLAVGDKQHIVTIPLFER